MEIVMITEDYVNFETAKLLKEKGFNEDCRALYSSKGKFEIVTKMYLHDYFRNTNIEECCGDKFITAPTLQMAMKWLREVHNKIIVPGIRVKDQISGIINCYIVGIWYIPKNNGGAFCYTTPTPYDGHPSLEEACEAAIKYCLENLI